MGQSPDELFDIVDAQDRVVGKATRAEAHAQRLWHRAVHVLVFNAPGEVLLQQRSPFKDTFPGCWTSSCAGHVDSGDDYLETAVRELSEELGLSVMASALMPFGYLHPSEATGWEFLRLYHFQHEGPFTPAQSEVSALKWASPEALKAWALEAPEVFAPSFLTVWKCWQHSQTGLRPT
jgi:isopentenyl-diphosphate delta-isomerase type 1